MQAFFTKIFNFIFIPHLPKVKFHPSVEFNPAKSYVYNLASSAFYLYTQNAVLLVGKVSQTLRINQKSA